MSKATVLIAGAAGYVLGARAGRGRYEQIRSAASRIWGNPKVQSQVSTLEAKAADAAKSVAGAAQEKASTAASTVADKVRHRAGSDAHADTPPDAAGGTTVVLDDPVTPGVGTS